MPPAMDLRIKENMSTRKKGKLPDNLYHFTSLIKYRIILDSGKLALTPSNLKFDNETYHYEPIYFRGQEIGMRAVDKYKDHHPVVWLTANDHVTAQNTGLSDDKLGCRISIQTNGKFWHYLRWRDFCDKYHADPFMMSVLKRSAPDHANWYICESEIPLADFAKVEFLDQDGLYKEAHEIPGFSLEDVAPELFA